MKLNFGFSPCPNDTFAFDALVHHRIDTGDLEFEVVMEDVETLNELALQGELAITKLSYFAYAYAADNYQLLQSGSALGRGCGPLLIAKHPVPNSKIPYCVVGIPGRLTTANFLLSIAYPDAITKKEMLFSDIEDALLRDEIDLGLIIHENRFTYQQKGLLKIADLGEFWEQKYHLPIPLGAIAIKRSLSEEIKNKVNDLIRQSVEYAYLHPEQAMEYVKQHAQAMDPKVMQQHIDLYVNDFTVALGEEGRAAVEKLFSVAAERKIISPVAGRLFEN